MNLREAVSPFRTLAFRIWRCLAVLLPGGRIHAFGGSAEQIGAVLVINLDRQPRRWRRVTRELRRFRTSEGTPLIWRTQRLAAVDARDGRAVAATSDVDAMYRIGDQLYVQPDARLMECFADDEPVRMTRQEVAVARSHVEAWKTIANGSNDFVLILEDDVWFTPRAASAIDRAWRAALHRCASDGGPKLLYLSYNDAGGTALRQDVCDSLFRPVRGLWFLSGYVLSREGASQLLRAMPVVGPVDLWLNFRFAELGALAMSSPAITQRHDWKSDNVYSILPYLARAGIVDAEHGVKPPYLPSFGPILAWTGGAEQEGLAMALSMLGLRVRAFDGNEKALDERGISLAFKTFDVLVDAPLEPKALAMVAAHGRSVILLESDAPTPPGLEPDQLPSSRSAVLTRGDPWDALCGILGVVKPVEAFPTGAHRKFRVFRDDRRVDQTPSDSQTRRDVCMMDDSPWVLPPTSIWRPKLETGRHEPASVPPVVDAPMAGVSPSFPALVETFPGNLASFSRDNVQYCGDSAQLKIEASEGGLRPYRSGAFASVQPFTYGRFQAEIKAAPGPGLITGFFLHRATPRQEIDIELAGGDPWRMLVNVYFNPGDDGVAMGFGYRGTPIRIDLGFDATAGFHLYGIDWRPDRILWLVDDIVVHERVSWDPTPIPHLSMRLFANLWAPRSAELAGRVIERNLPTTAAFRNVLVTE